MEEQPYAEIIAREFAFLFEAGFTYEYLYDKGSDSSCVYIYRFRKGRDFFDFRAVSGGGGGTCVACVGGGYVFPDFKRRHKKLIRGFIWKHLFRAASAEERWAFAAELLRAEAADGNLFGLPLV